MNRIILSTTLALSAATPLVAHCEDYNDNLNRFFLGARFGMNIKADFRNNAVFSGPINPGPATGGANHIYNDGYVLLDSSGNAGGQTWNWGYQNAAQVVGDTTTRNATMQFNAILSSGAASVTDNPQYGGEVVYQRVMGHITALSSGHWGIELAFGLTDINLKANRNGTADVITDSYALNGTVPLSPGYNGTFNGPGGFLDDLPTRTFGTALVTSNQKLSGQVFSIRIGPFAEWNFTPEFSLSASAGLTLAPALMDYDFSESSSIIGGGSTAASGHSSKTELLYGPYVGAMLRYDFNRSWGIYIGAQFQSLNDVELSSGTHTARLDQSATVYATIGLSWKF